MRAGLVLVATAILVVSTVGTESCQGEALGPRASGASERASRLASVGEELLDRGLYSTARDTLERALDLDPDCARAHAYLAAEMLSARLGEGAAEFHLGRAVTLAPNDAATLEAFALARFSEVDVESVARAVDWAEQNGIESPGLRFWKATRKLIERDYSDGYQILQELQADGGLTGLPFSSLVQATMYMDGEGAAEELLSAFCDPSVSDYSKALTCAQTRLMINPQSGLARDEFLRAASTVPDDPHGIYHLGKVMVDFDEFKLAESFFEANAHRIDPTLPWEYWYGMALIGSRDLDEAGVVVRRALDESPSNLALHRELGHVLGYTGDIDGATAEFAQVAAQDTTDAEAAWVLASLLIQKGDYEEVVVLARRSVRHDALDFRLWNNLAAYEKELGNEDAFLDALTHAVEVAPHRPKLRFQLVNALTEAGRTALAIEHMDLVTGPAPWQLSDGVQMYELLAYAAAEVGDSERGARAGRSLLEKNSTKFEAFAAAAEAMSLVPFEDGFRGGDIDTTLVLKLVTRARELNSVEPRGLHRISKCATRVGQDKLAREIVLEAIAMDPTYLGAYHAAAYLSNALDEPEEAARYARAALELKLGDSTALYNLGRSLRLQGRFDEAIEQLELAAAAGDTSIGFSVEMALSYASAGRHEDAMSLAHRVVASGAKFGQVVYQFVGRYYDEVGDTVLLEATYEASRRSCDEVGKEHWGDSIQEWLEDDRVSF